MSADADVLAQMAARLRSGAGGALMTLVEARGSVPQRPGARAIVTPEGAIVGTIGGGCLEHEARRAALDVLAGAPPRLLEIRLNHDVAADHGLICGGTARVWIERLAPPAAELLERASAARAERRPAALVVGLEPGQPALAVAVGDEALGDPALGALGADALATRQGGLAADDAAYIDLILPQPRLWIAGAGHVGRAVARHASHVDFEIAVVDERPDFCRPEHVPWARQHVVGDIEAELAARAEDLGDEDYVLIVTRGHQHDAGALRAVVRSGARYIGLIGSRRKIKLIGDSLLEAGDATPEQLARVFAPVGLDIGAELVDEIAVAVTAELVAVRRGRLARPGDPLPQRPSRAATTHDAR